MAGLNIAGNSVADIFKCDANDALQFRLVREQEDLFKDDNTFKPDMTHQLFGDSESIFGYQDLKVQICCSAARLTTYVNLKYTEKISPEKFDGVHADDVFKVLKEYLQPGFLTNRDEYVAQVAKDASFKPFGEKIHSYKVIKDGKERQFEIYKTQIEAPGFRDFHERLQPFLMFYVDAASYIDVDDEKWDFYLLFESYQSNGNPMYAIAGYMTVYNYYAYPEKVRPRISQILVLPPFQKQGHGATLLQSFYNQCDGDKTILDITVEDPSENFQRVRDFVDARNALKLKSYSKENLHEGFSQEMVDEVREKLKLNKKQARRIYEILRLKATDANSKEQWKSYRIEIKKRLNVPFQKNGRDFQKLQKALNANELAATMNNLSTDQRLDYLEKTFTETIEEYGMILDRLSM